MSWWIWVLIAIAVVAVAATLAWQALERRRTTRLRQRFGSEYDRTVESAESRRTAEDELRAREERRRQLDIRPLSHAARERYASRWQAVQAEFVDAPRSAVGSADALVQAVMSERGYPMDDFEQRAADISVDHPDVVENFRQAHRLAQAGDNPRGSTEDLRKAMQHYRALFEELLEPDADRPLARDETADEAPVTDAERARR